MVGKNGAHAWEPTGTQATSEREPSYDYVTDYSTAGAMSLMMEGIDLTESVLTLDCGVAIAVHAAVVRHGST